MDNIKGQELIYKIVFALLIIGSIYYYYKNKSFRNNEFATIAKVYKIKYAKSRPFARYKFFYLNKVYDGSNALKNKNNRYLIGKFYKVRLDSLNPNYSRLDLESEVADTILIRKAGFKN